MAEERQNSNRRPADASPRPGRRRKKKKSALGPVILSVVLLLCVSTAIAVYAIRSASDMFGLNQEDRDIDVVIENGMGVSQIAQLLSDKGIVTHPGAFKAYVGLRAKGVPLQAGEYVLNSNMSYDQIIAVLRAGDVVRDEVRLTFYEGMTMREIARQLEENNVCDADEFIDYVESADFEYEFCQLIPENELRFRRMEGYLFPDTYDFYQGETVASVAKKFLRNFSNRVYSELYDEIRDAGMTLDEAVTLASIIQKEASNEQEMATVSSVFHNRMENTAAGLPMLQSDVTINYVEDDIKVYQTRTTQEIYDAYNTYVCRGLPAGPICSPGLAAIKAAIHPAETNYYFFVTDVNGVYYYGRTLDEHNANVYTASRVGLQHGTDIS